MNMKKKLVIALGLVLVVLLVLCSMNYREINGVYQKKYGDTQITLTMNNGRYSFSGELSYSYIGDIVPQSGYIYQQKDKYYYLTSKLNEGPYFEVKGNNIILHLAVHYSTAYEFYKIR